jgi:hypothetical protein
VLKQNVAAYLALPVPRYASQQAAALAVFDHAYAGLLSGCNVGSLGNAGQRCVIERLSPSFCAANPQYIGQATNLGTTCGRFPWPDWYRTPVAQDPNVVPDPVATVGGGSGSVPGQTIDANGNPVGSASSANTTMLWIAAGLIAAAFIL